jgi:hypothetical protein
MCLNLAVPYKTKCATTIGDPAIVLVGVYPKQMNIYFTQDLYMNVHSNFTQNRKCWKQPRSPSPGE